MVILESGITISMLILGYLVFSLDSEIPEFISVIPGSQIRVVHHVIQRY